MNYKKIGDYIQQVNLKNEDGEVKNLLGVNLDKVFMPSVANLNGVDMTKYKIIKKGQFGCKLMSVGRDKKLPISHLTDYDKAIISSAYYVFEVKNENELLPEYLMMWFSRPESDRFLWFLSGGDVRGRITWEDLCTLPIRIPSIEKQQQIVNEYNTVTNRIQLNQKINTNLKATAQALYKHWFVDFEFPNQEGKPYKSSGGKMVYNEELDKDIPVGWFDVKLNTLAKISAGGDKPRKFNKTKSAETKIPVYSNSSEDKGVFGFTDIPKIKNKSITVSARGAIIGYTVLRTEPFYPIIRLIVVTPIDDITLNYLYEVIFRFNYDQTSSAQGQLTSPEMKSKIILKPDDSILKIYQKLTKITFDKIHKNETKSQTLQELQSLLLAKMTQVELKPQVV